MHTSIVCGEFFAQYVARFWNDANAAPVRITNLHYSIELLARRRVTAWTHNFRVTIIEEMPAIPELSQYRVHCRQQRIRSKPGYGRRNIVLVDNELPLLRAHYGGHMSRRNERVEARGF